MVRLPEDSSMDLLLWRHAEAEDGLDDMKRPLSENGRQQAQAMAVWIRAHRPDGLRIIASPSLRTVQTAAALGLPFETSEWIRPGASTADLITAAGWPTAGGAVLIVGHQPTLGRLAALLLAGRVAEWTIKRGALWWLRNQVRTGESQTMLRAALPSEWAL
jgi:phosphohistidine phosphatase